ncbi:MAG TPA: CHRD domain-containing protein [Chloroflexota bacterium]
MVQLARTGQRLPLAALLAIVLISGSLSGSARGSTLQQTPTFGCNATSNFFFTTMTTQQESPIPGPGGPPPNPTGPSTLPGNGLATALLDPTQTQLRVTLSYQGLSSGAKRFHIHQLVPPTAPHPEPPANATGAIIIPFIEPAVPATAPDIPNPLLQPPPPIILNVAPLPPSQINALQTIRTPDASYFNVHTLTNPGGEIRGATICATLTPPGATPGCTAGQLVSFAVAQASGSIICGNPFSYNITPAQVPADAPVGSRPVVMIPVVNGAGQPTFDTFNCDSVISAARTVTCTGTGSAGDQLAQSGNMFLVFEGALTSQPTGTLQPVLFAPAAVSTTVGVPPVSGQANTPCAGTVGQGCSAAGGVTGTWIKRGSGNFTLTATGPGNSAPAGTPVVFIPTTRGVESFPCLPLPLVAPFTTSCIGITVGDPLQGALITVRFPLAGLPTGATADVTGVITGPGPAAPAVVPVAPVAPAAAAATALGAGGLVPPLLPPLPPLPPPPPPMMLPPFGAMGGMGAMPSAAQAAATATPTPAPESRRPAPPSTSAQYGGATSAQTGGSSADPLPAGAPPARPPVADAPTVPAAVTGETMPAAPGSGAIVVEPGAMFPGAAPASATSTVEGDPASSSVIPADPGELNSVEPPSLEP